MSTNWEECKENYVPVREGRKPTLLSPPPAAPVDSVEEKRKSFWAEVSSEEQEGEQGDPLEKWLKFIKWTQETSWAQGHKVELQKVLEACTRKIGVAERYKGDIRYLRVWIQYADCLQDPSDIFLYLKDANIGQGFALFYEAYATYLELKGSFERAALVYDEGLALGATPTERLKHKHVAFQQRMAQRMQRAAQDEALTGSSADAAAAPARAALQGLVPLGGRGAGSSGGSVRGSQQPASSGRAALGSGFGTAAPAAPLANVAPRMPLGGGSLGVHVDDEFEAGGAGSVLTAFPPALPHQAPLPRYGVARKENAGQASAWAGVRLVQAGSAGAVPVASNRLEVLEDEEFVEQDAQPAAPQPALRQVLDSAAASKAPAAMPSARNLGLAGLHPVSTLPAPSSQHAPAANRPAAAAAPAPAASKPAASGGQGYDASCLVDSDGEELCFEELRAMAWRQRQPPAAPQQAAPAAAVTSTHPPEPQALPAGRRQGLSVCADHMPVAPAQSQPAAKRQRSPEQQCQQQLQDENNPQAAPPVAAATLPPPPAPQQQPLAVPPAAHRLPQLPAPEPTVTLSMRAALDAMNDIFCDDLPTGGLGLDGAFHMGVYGEPTMTVNTRAAMDMVNQMFAGGGGDTTTVRLPGRPGSQACQPSAAELNARRRSQVHGVGEGPRRSGRPSIAAGAGTCQLPLYEDTEFIGQALAGERTAAGSNGGGSAAGGGGFELYEDTEYLGAAADAARAADGDCGGAGGSSGGGLVWEDTEFITRDVAQAAVRGSSSAGMAPPAGAGGGGGLLMYNDTELLTENMVAAARAAAAGGTRSDRGALQPAAAARPAAAAQLEAESTTGMLRSVKESLPAHVARQVEPACSAARPPAGLPRTPSRGSQHNSSAPRTPLAVHADPFCVMDSPAARAALGGAQPFMPSPACSPDVAGPKENDGPSCARPPRHAGSPRAMSRALQPVTAERAALLGIQLDEDSGTCGPPAQEGSAEAVQRHSPGPRALRSLFQE